MQVAAPDGHEPHRAWPWNVDPVHRLMHEVGIGGFVAAGAVLAADALLTSVLARELRRTLRLSSSLAWLYVVLAAVRCVAPADGDLDPIFRVVSAVALSLAVAQTAFVLVVDFLFGRNGRRPLRPLIRYALLAITFLVAALTGLRAGGVATVGVLASGAVVIGGVGAAVAEILRQVGAGILMQFARPFEIGDVVRTKGIERRATVVATSWRTTALRAVDGLELLIPNSDFVTQLVVNYGHGERVFRREIKFEAPYEVAPDRVRAVVLASIRGVGGVEAEPAPNVLLMDFADSSMAYELRYWTKRAADHELVDDVARRRIWSAFARSGIAFPSPARAVQLVTAPALADRLEERVRALRSAQLFSALPEEALRELAESGHEQPWADGESIVEAGESGREMHVLLSGAAQIVAADDRRELFRLGPGDYFGEMALLTGEPRTASVVAADAARTFVLDEPSFRAMLARHPDVAEMLATALSTRTLELRSKLEQRTVDAEERGRERLALLSRIRSIFGFRDG